MRFTFGQFVLDVQERSLRDDDGLLPLAPKAFDTLVLLLQNAGKILSKERLMTEVWQDAFVEENNLAQNISILRKVLRESRGQKYIETVPKFGYRFVAEVQAEGVSSVPEEVVESVRGRVYISDNDGGEHISGKPQRFVTPLRPETNYVQNGDVNIAYQVLGDGPIDIVFVMGCRTVLMARPINASIGTSRQQLTGQLAERSLAVFEMTHVLIRRLNGCRISNSQLMARYWVKSVFGNRLVLAGCQGFERALTAAQSPTAAAIRRFAPSPRRHRDDPQRHVDLTRVPVRERP